jgi:gliding motility-associated-like protein
MNQHSGYYDVATINQFGCKGARTGINVSVHELPIISLGNDTSVCNNLPFFLEPNNSFVSYNWSTGNNLSTQSVDTTATLSLTVTDANGCLAYDTIIVTVLNCDLTLQNVFSPDGDGVNDNFVLASNGFLNYNINVYDRWGQVVFNSLSGVNYWDGKNKLGNYVDAGTYYFTVEAVDIANQKGFWKSYVNVIK